MIQLIRNFLLNPLIRFFNDIQKFAILYSIKNKNWILCYILPSINGSILSKSFSIWASLELSFFLTQKFDEKTRNRNR